LSSESAKTTLLSMIDAAQLPKRYGGDRADDEVFNYVDPLYRGLVGMSSEPETYDVEGAAHSRSKSQGAWQHTTLNAERWHTLYVTVQRGQHCKWQFLADRPRVLLYAVTFEPEEWEAQTIEVRPEEEIECGYFPMSGDYIIKQAGCFTMRFKNVQEEPLHLRYKLAAETMSRAFIDRYLPNYEQEPLPDTPRRRTAAVIDHGKRRVKHWKLLVDGFLRECFSCIPLDIVMMCQKFFNVEIYALRHIYNLPSGSLKKIATKVVENSDLYNKQEDSIKKIESIWSTIESKKKRRDHKKAQKFFEESKKRDKEVNLRKALRIEPGNWQYHFELGKFLRHERRYEEALEEFLAADRIVPAKGRCLFYIAQIYEKLGHYQDAEAYYNKCVTAEPLNAVAHHGYGLFLRDHVDDLDRAERCFKKAILIDPSRRSLHSDYAYVLYLAGRNDEAMIEIKMEQSYHFNDQVPMTSYILGLLLEAVGLADDATVEVEKALDMCTTSERVARMAEAVRRMLEQDSINGDYHRRFERMLQADRV